MTHNKNILKLDSQNQNFILIKHYNSVALTNVEKIKIETKNPNTVVCIHDFLLSDIVGVFEPFLDWIRESLSGIRDDDIDDILTKCNVYSLHKSLFKSFIKTGKCIREEMLLIDEVEFEQEKIASAVVNLVSYAAGEKHVVFLLNDLQYAGGSIFHFIHNLLETKDCRNVSVIATYNESKVPMPHIEPLWEKFYSYICANNHVAESNYGSYHAPKNGIKDLTFAPELVDSYILKLNNLLFCLDFSQAKHYLEIIYKMITIEEIVIKSDQKYEIIRLFALVSIYTQDFSQALLLCEKLNDFRSADNSDIDFTYFYFMCLAHMYNGKLDEAQLFALDCLEIGKAANDDYEIFLSNLLSLMVKMSGWHNIFFCAYDIPVEPKLLEQAQKYNFKNHLAHIYVYAYDNEPSLFKDAKKVDEKLIHFNKGIDIMKELGNEYFLLEAYRNNIMIASTNGFFKTAAYYYSKCHELVKGRDQYEEAMIYNGMGYISTATEDYEKAFDCYNMSLKIFLKTEKIDYVGETLYNMAINCLMAQDYKNAYDCLELSYRIVKETKMNSLRVCNISKLAGLLSLCSYYNGNEMKYSMYAEKTRLFLEHLFDKDDSKSGCTVIHDYTMCKDDMFIYYFICALKFKEQSDYDKADKNFRLALSCIGDSLGNQFCVFKQFTSEYVSLCRLMGQNEKADSLLLKAISIYEKQECGDKVSELKSELEKRTYKIPKHKLHLPQALRNDINETLRHAAIFKENQEQKKRMNFLSAWPKIIEIGNNSKHELVLNAVNAFMHNFNIDKLMLVKYHKSRHEILYNNTSFVFDKGSRHQIENFFHRNRLGFVTSKINNNYIDYTDFISLFEKNNVCSIIGIPFYYNNSLSAIMVAYISMKDNWHSPATRYLLDESDYAAVEFEIRQLLTAIDMLEANDKIKCMNDKLNHIAVTDKLTGLYNREGFYDNILKRSGQKASITIMYIDLDNFKYYNDTFGHGVGDIILIEMAKIFNEAVGDNGFVTRYGGDEFIITLYSGDKAVIKSLAEKIYKKIADADGFSMVVMNKLGKTINIPENHRISCSIGISSINSLKDEEQLEKVLREADKVLYDVKKSGKGVFKFYSS